MGRPSKHTADEVIEAISGTDGIKTKIAEKLKVKRHTIDRYLKKYESVKIAYDDEVNIFGDVTESVIITSIRDDHNVETAKWYAKMKLSHRGYKDKQEIEHAGTIAQPTTFAEWIKIETERNKK